MQHIPQRWQGSGLVLRATAGSLLLVGILLGAAQAEEADADALARKVMELAGVERGVCAVAGRDRDVAVRLARHSGLLVHVREPDAAAVATLRSQADEAGLGIARLIVEHGPLARLPYANSLVDVVVATAVDPDALARPRLDEVLRVLRPGGKAVLRTAQAGAGPIVALRKWASAGGAESVKAWGGPLGTWLTLTKPIPEGMDEWSHWEHGPDNNPVSTDRVIRAPYLTQFLAEPYAICMPAITTAAGGRTFLATGHIAHHPREWEWINKLVARNGYNGTVLWQRDLPKGFLAHRSAFVATRDVFYLMDGEGCLKLDAATGEERGRLQIPGLRGEWKWMAMQDGILYALAGDRGGAAVAIKGDRNFGGWSWADLSEGYYRRPRVPWGFGHTLAAWRIGDEESLWKHGEKAGIDSRAMALRDGKLFLYCPGERLRCLDAKTGKIAWTNAERETLSLIEQPGRGLTSTPGFRSSCITVATPKALVIQGQTRMNVIAVSTGTGKLLWQKRKVSNNPNVIFVDGRLVLGVGQRSRHVAVDPVSGEVIEDLGFWKVSCARLTASPDSFFCRGEGLARYDRASKKLLIDGAARPGCNDGALPANGMLYLGPWACDCNLSLIGAMARCSAGSFKFDHSATDAARLHRGEGDLEKAAPFAITEADWPTFRADVDRSAATTVHLARPNAPKDTPPAPTWDYAPAAPHVPTPPVAAGGLILVAGQDGKVRALDAGTGRVRWAFATAGPIKATPTLWEGRVYVGSGDGHVYALEAATGRLLWTFRAAPAERHIMVYGNLCSTWPVNTGVLVREGVAYFAAGIIDSDGTYVYALNARTGTIKWQNNSSGHLSPDLRKGVSAQGCLAVRGGELLMAGGNQTSPGRYKLDTGQCVNPPFAQGQPKANHGRVVGVFLGKYPLAGGRPLYADPANVANKDSFVVHNDRTVLTLNFGGVPPAWNGDTVAFVNYRDGKLTCCDAAKVAARVDKGLPPSGRGDRRRWFALAQTFGGDGAVRWVSDLGQPDKFEVASIALCPGSVVIVAKWQVRNRAHPQWSLAALDSRNGTPYWFWRYLLPSTPLPGGLLVGRRGQVVVTLLDGRVLSFGPRRPPTARGSGVRD